MMGQGSGLPRDIALLQALHASKHFAGRNLWQNKMCKEKSFIDE